MCHKTVRRANLWCPAAIQSLGRLEPVSDREEDDGEARRRGRGQRGRGGADDPPPRGTAFSARVHQVSRLGAKRGQDGEVPRRRSSDSRAVRRRILGRRDRAVEHAGQRLAPVEPDRGGRRRGRRRQLERLPHGPRRSPGRARSQSPRHPQAPRDHRQPQLFDDPMVVALKPLHDAVRVRRVVVSHLPIGLGRRPEGHPRARSSDRGPRQEEPSRPLRPSSPIRSSATASPRSTTSCRTATPRKR